MTKQLHHGVRFREWNLSHSRFKGQVAMMISIYRVSVCSIYKRRGKSLFYCKKWPQDVALSLRYCFFKFSSLWKKDLDLWDQSAHVNFQRCVGQVKYQSFLLDIAWQILNFVSIDNFITHIGSHPPKF